MSEYINREVKGYKATKKDMTCQGMQYEIGVTYRAQGRVEMCKNGFHFCRELRNVFDYYERDSRVFEVLAKEEDTDGQKSVASEITLIRELPQLFINRKLYGDGKGDGNGNGYGYGDGYGKGNGDGKGNGYGDGYGKGNGDGKGKGNGYGDGDGYGKGNGDGYGDGYGYGNSYGNGKGDGDGGRNIQKILKLEV